LLTEPVRRLLPSLGIKVVPVHRGAGEDHDEPNMAVTSASVRDRQP